MQSSLQHYIERLTTQIPMLLVLIATIVVSLLNWNRHRRAAALAFSGASLLIVVMISFIFVWDFVVTRASNSGASMQSVFRVYSIINNLLHAVGMALIVAGVFAGRESETFSRRGFSVGGVPGTPPPMPQQSQRGW